MANGRLGNCLIPPYSGVEIYANSSGQSASISINTQVIHSTAESEITTTVGTSSTTLTGVTNLATTGCYCRLIGYHIDSNGYYGAFSANTITPSCPIVNRYIACDGTVTTGFTTTTTCCIPFGGSEIVNPLLRYDTPSTTSPECCPGISATIGFVAAPCSSVSCWYVLNKYTVTSPNCAATTLVNPCCNSRYANSACGSICTSPAAFCTLNYYALSNITGCDGAYCFCTNSCNAITVVTGNNCMSFLGLFGCSCSSYTQVCNYGIAYICFCCCLCSALNHAISLIDGFPKNSFSTTTCCWYCNSSGCLISPYGVHSAATCAISIHTHWLKDTVRYLTTPTNGCLLANCANCFGYAVDTWICPATSTNCELPVKYLSYNPNTRCVYMMVRSQNPDECGIFSVSTTTLCSCYNTPRTGTLCSSNIYCVTLQSSPLYCKVANFPDIMTCSYYTSPFMCVSCIFRSGNSSWALSIYNCCSAAWDTFTSSNLIDWQPATTSLLYYESDTSNIISTTSCVYRNCNCFISNVNYSGMIDYKVSANNYERTGVVVSNGDRVFINNNSNHCMSAQVWGYEG